MTRLGSATGIVCRSHTSMSVRLANSSLSPRRLFRVHSLLSSLVGIGVYCAGNNARSEEERTSVPPDNVGFSNGKHVNVRSSRLINVAYSERNRRCIRCKGKRSDVPDSRVLCGTITVGSDVQHRAGEYLLAECSGLLLFVRELPLYRPYTFANTRAYNVTPWFALHSLRVTSSPLTI